MFLRYHNIYCVYIVILYSLTRFHLTETATEYNRYLAHIFNKYGTGGTMTFEGLEHLMYSLGLGQIELEHTLDDHHPNDFYMESNRNEQLKKYFEDETKIFLTNDRDFIQSTNMQSIVDQADSQILNEKIIDSENIYRSKTDKGIILEFKEMHDPRHRHPRENDAFLHDVSLSDNVCLSPKSLLSLVINHNDLHKQKFYKTFASSMSPSSTLKYVESDEQNLNEEYNKFLNNVKLTPMAFMKLCPALLAQVDQKVCVRPAPLMYAEDQKFILWNAWIYASASIFTLSVCGLFGILLVPLMKTQIYQELLQFLVSIAVGTLSGDALMHLLPHALSKNHGVSTEHMLGEKDSNNNIYDTTPVWICACAFGAAVLMYILENLVPILKKANNNSGHQHGHSHVTHTHSDNEFNLSAPDTDVMETNIMLNELKEDLQITTPTLSPVAFMVIIGDGLHNLTDGLAIGAAFASDPVTGIATTFAVLCHELPHELGDFALLLQVGVPIRRIICLNIVSSVLSFVGMAVGLVISSLNTSTAQWVYAVTAGSFLYIAFADLLPAMGRQEKRTIKDVLIEIIGFLLGGVIMLLIAVNENELEMLFK